MDDLLKAALIYAERGQPVFPCRPDKTPYTPSGFKDATTDPTTLISFWTRWEAAAIGLPTGTPSGVIVIDLDVDKEKGIDGPDEWQTLCAPHEEIHTREVLTPRGGSHLYFKIPPGFEIRNSAGKLGRGIDVRGEGGYVILPPSVMPNGSYMLEASSPREPAEMPPWLIAKIAATQPTRDDTPRATAAPSAPGNVREYLDGSFEEGGRNDALTRQAGLMRRAGMEPDEIRPALMAINESRCNPPLPEDEVSLIAWSSARWEPGSSPDEPLATDAAADIEIEKPKYEIVHGTELADQPIPTWLVRGVLPSKGVAVLYGASGSGKTFAALDLAMSVVQGKRWMDRRVKRGAVVYIATEGALRLRVKAYGEEHEIDDKDLYVFGALESSINLLERSGQELAEIVHAVITFADRCDAPVAAVIVDTLNRAMPGGDENGSEHMGRAVASASHIATALDCLCLLVHHSGKDATKGGRGHSSLKAAVDAEISVRRNGDRRLITAEKVRDGVDTLPIGAFELKTINMGLVRDDDPEADMDETYTSCVLDMIPIDDYEPDDEDDGPKLGAPARKMLGFIHKTFDRFAQPGATIRAHPHPNPPIDGQNVIARSDLDDVIEEGGGMTDGVTLKSEMGARRRALAQLVEKGEIHKGGTRLIHYYWLALE